MAEFTELPCATGELPKDNWWNELRTAILNRQELLEELDDTSPWQPSFLGTPPTAAAIGDLWKRIAAYRDKIDALAPFFYTEASIVAVGAPTAYTSSTLHNAAFGQNDWRETSFPGAPRIILWNDMKTCLDLLKWAQVNSHVGGTPWIGNIWEGTNKTNATWNTCRNNWFASLAQSSTTHDDVGRAGKAKLDTIYYAQDTLVVYGTDDVHDNDEEFGNLDSLTNPPSVVDGYFYADLDSGLLAADYFTNVSLWFALNTTIVMTASDSVDVSANAWHGFRLDNIAAATLNLNGTNNDLEIRFDGTMTTDIGATEWPAPAGTTWETWCQAVHPGDWKLYLKFSWD